MPRFFSYYWDNNYCDDMFANNWSNVPIGYCEGTGFSAAGVAPGDALYVLGDFDGSLALVARMEVGEIITDIGQLRKATGERFRKGMEIVEARDGSGTPMQFLRELPWEVIGELRFITSKGALKPVKLKGDAEVEQASVNGLRELSEESAMLLDVELTQPYSDTERLNPEMPDEEPEIEDEEFLQLARQQEKEDVSGERARLDEAAREQVLREFTAAGWEVRGGLSAESPYDFLCKQGDHTLALVVRGCATDSLSFPLDKLAYSFLEEEPHAALCLVVRPASSRPVLHTITADELFDRFDARPLRWMFRERPEEEEEE